MHVNKDYFEYNVNLLMQWSQGIEQEAAKISQLFWLNVHTGELSKERNESTVAWTPISLHKEIMEINFTLIESDSRPLSASALHVYQQTTSFFKKEETSTQEEGVPNNLKQLAEECFGKEKCLPLLKSTNLRQFNEYLQNLAKERLEEPRHLTEKEIVAIAKLFSSPSLKKSYNLEELDHYHPIYIFLQLNEVIQAFQNGVKYVSTSGNPTDENKFAGNNESYFLLDNEEKRLWVFKPESGEGINSDGRSGLNGIPAGKGAKREHVAALLNYHRMYPIPYTAYVMIGNRVGSVQQYVPEAKKFSHLRNSAETRKMLENLPAGPFQSLILFDLMHSNCDRNGANILCKGTQVVGIDHGSCMTASADDPLMMEYLTLKQLVLDPFTQELSEFILNIDTEKECAIMRRHGIEENAIEWKKIATYILQIAIKMSDESIKKEKGFLSSAEIAIVISKLREKFWVDPSSKHIENVFSELLNLKVAILDLDKEKKLTPALLAKMKSDRMKAIKEESIGGEYQMRISRLNLFFNKIFPNFCTQLTGENFNIYE